jgi:hypothetical protein
VFFDSPAGYFSLIQHNTKGAKNPDGSWAFDRTWADFSTGFGDASLDAQFYWRGLQKVHEWTKSENWELMVRLRWADDDSIPSLRGKWGWRLYTGFRIGSEAGGFTFNVVEIKDSANMPQGTDYLVMDSESYERAHNGMKFTTKDAGNDNSGNNCAHSYGVGWWYNYCYQINLNGGSHGSVWSGPSGGRSGVTSPREAIMAIRQINPGQVTSDQVTSGQVTSGSVAAAAAVTAAVTAAVNQNLSISIDFYVIGCFLFVF